MQTQAYRCISGDLHLEVDARRWLHRVPAQYRERAPRLIRMATGGDAWRPFGQTYEGTPGTGSPEQRIAEQERDGIDAEVLYPTPGR